MSMQGGIMDDQTQAERPLIVPFASLPAASTVEGQVRRLTELPHVSLIALGGIWRPLNGRATLYHRNTNPITIQSLTPQDAETVTFPGGLVRAGMRVNIDQRVSIAGIGTGSRIIWDYLGPVGSSSQTAGSAAYTNSNTVNEIRKLSTIDCLADGSATHLGGSSQPSGMQYNSTVWSPVVDFSLPWEARVAMQSAAETTVGISTASWAANVVTFDTTAAHTLAVGDKTVVGGVTPSGYNGTYVVVSVPSTTRFTAELLTDPGAYTSGGTSSRISNMILKTLTITLEG